MEGVKTKKYLGQHFLKDDNIARKIVNSLLITPGINHLLEIGAGQGALTKFLLKKENYQLSIVEVDKEAVIYLNELYPELKEDIIFNDFLKLKIDELFTSPIDIIGNFPYNISSQIFFKILQHTKLVNQIVCMIQKEVAERISSPAGTKKYGILSVLLQAHYTIKYLFTVSENVFSPRPRVKSAVIRLLKRQTKRTDYNEILFFNIVKTSFNQRRKTLRNSLKKIIEFPTTDHEIFDKRPEQLNVDDFIYITNLVQNLNSPLTMISQK